MTIAQGKFSTERRRLKASSRNRTLSTRSMVYYNIYNIAIISYCLLLYKYSCYSNCADDVATTSSTSSNNDICRICHMGNSTSTQSFLGEHGNPDASRIGNRSSSCNFNLGLLVSACRCIYKKTAPTYIS